MIIVLACLVALILLVWFKTEAVLEYGRLIGLGKFLKDKEFQDKKILESYPLNYPRFLRITYNNFFIRMITCSICLAVWLAIIVCILTGYIVLIPVVCIYSLLAYAITSTLLDHIK